MLGAKTIAVSSRGTDGEDHQQAEPVLNARFAHYGDRSIRGWRHPVYLIENTEYLMPEKKRVMNVEAREVVFQKLLCFRQWREFMWYDRLIHDSRPICELLQDAAAMLLPLVF